MTLADAIARRAAELLADEERRAREASVPRPSREEFVISTEWCAFPSASEAQRALLQAADGHTPELPPDRSLFHFGIEVLPPSEPPSTVIVEAGVRSGKSLLAALAGCIYGALFADLSSVRPGELVRALIVAPRLDLSAATFAHVVGTMAASPRLRGLFPKPPGVESAVIRRPDGHEVEIKLVAAAKGGTNLRSTWLAACVLDEADFHDGEDASVNLKTNYDAVVGRMLPGAQIWMVSSPWADTGPFHSFVTEYLGNPRNGMLVYHSDSRSMNPSLPTGPEAELRAKDPDTAAREYDAIPISSSGTEFFAPAAIRAAVNIDRPLMLPPIEAMPHWAGTDLGFRKNSSALAVAGLRNGKKTLVFHCEERPEPGKPLKPSVVIATFARVCLSYFCSTVRGDLHYSETAHEEFPKTEDARGSAIAYDEWAPTQEGNAELYTKFRRLLLEGQVELPNDPRLLYQLEKVKMRVLPAGRIAIVLPKIGHTHGDVLTAVVIAIVQVPDLMPGSGLDEADFVDDSRWAGMPERGF